MLPMIFLNNVKVCPGLSILDNIRLLLLLEMSVFSTSLQYFTSKMVPRQLLQSFSLNQSLIFIAEHKPDVLVIVAFLYSILSHLQN